MPIKQRTDDGSVRPANPRPLDPSMPDDGGAGGIATPDGSQPGDEGAPPERMIATKRWRWATPGMGRRIRCGLLH